SAVCGARLVVVEGAGPSLWGEAATSAVAPHRHGPAAEHAHRGPRTCLPHAGAALPLREGSGGRGLAPGGEGIERDLLMLEDVTVSLITERRVSRPWGLAGGEPGAVGENWLLPGGDESRARRLPDKVTLRFKAGDVLRMLTPGGGGWGPPTTSP